MNDAHHADRMEHQRINRPNRAQQRKERKTLISEQRKESRKKGSELKYVLDRRSPSAQPWRVNSGYPKPEMYEDIDRVVYVLTASHTSVEEVLPPETYVFHGENAFENANRFSMSLIAEYVDGNWDKYPLRARTKFRALVVEERFLDARRQWNDMSTYQLDVEDIESTDVTPSIPNFDWLEGEDE